MGGRRCSAGNLSMDIHRGAKANASRRIYEFMPQMRIMALIRDI